MESGARYLFLAANVNVSHLQHLPAIFLLTMSVSRIAGRCGFALKPDTMCCVLAWSWHYTNMFSILLGPQAQQDCVCLQKVI